MTNNSWTVNVDEDPVTGDLFILLPPELLEIQGWGEGTVLKWIDNNDGSWSLEKVTND